MAADPKALALRAAQILANKDALTEAQAIGKAIRGQGITDRSSVTRLMKIVGTEFARNKRDAERAVRKAS